MADKRIYELPAAATLDTTAYLATDSAADGTKKVTVRSVLDAAGGKATILTQTLAASSTSVVFTGVPTTGTNMIELYTDKAGLDYDSVDDSTSGQLTYTFEAQSAAVTCYLVIREAS